jgi:hypothetical protein
MTIEEISSRQEMETKVFEVAKKIRAMLDKAGSEIELPDGRDAVEEILALLND